MERKLENLKSKVQAAEDAVWLIRSMLGNPTLESVEKLFEAKGSFAFHLTELANALEAL